MELTGIHIDTEYAKRLHQKYQSKLDDIDKKIDEELNKLAPTIEKWRQSPDANVSIKGGKTKNQQLTNPINFSSPLQVAIIFYDILKVPVINKKQPRSTDKATLDIIAERYDIPLAKLKKERAAIKILLDTFIDKLPTNINVKDNKLHCEFNQYGAVTGRFSSSSPNLQNIPSHAYDIRKMFVPSKNNVFVGSDYSGQEIRLMAALSNSKSMKQALKEGKDLYVVIAQQIYHNNYEDNLEFYPEGTILEIDGKKTVCGKNYVNIEGKKRRGVAKMINLAILYGMGPNLLSKKIESTYQEAQSILNNFFKEFPDVKTFIDNTQQKAKTLYYVEDFMGRRRHLRELTLSPYEAKYKDTDKMLKENFNPLLICSSKKLDTSLLDKYLDKCKNLKNPSEFSELSKNASQEGVILTSNQSTIAMAERQAVNFVVQGSAASLTKMAMVDIAKDKILNDLGFKLVLTIHDEVIGECPKENAEEVGKRLSYLMVNASHNLLDVPFKCDAEISNYWGEEVLESSVKKDYETLLSKMSQQEAFQKLCDIHSEFLPNQLKELVDIFN